jgi:hypothetical protein
VVDREVGFGLLGGLARVGVSTFALTLQESLTNTIAKNDAGYILIIHIRNLERRRSIVGIQRRKGDFQLKHALLLITFCHMYNASALSRISLG